MSPRPYRYDYFMTEGSECTKDRQTAMYCIIYFMNSPLPGEGKNVKERSDNALWILWTASSATAIAGAYVSYKHVHT